MTTCHMCKRETFPGDDPRAETDPRGVDCGGDCRGCMADSALDPHERRILYGADDPYLDADERWEILSEMQAEEAATRPPI